MKRIPNLLNGLSLRLNKTNLCNKHVFEIKSLNNIQWLVEIVVQYILIYKIS
jgi:hypothetical protein